VFSIQYNCSFVRSDSPTTRASYRSHNQRNKKRRNSTDKEGRYKLFLRFVRFYVFTAVTMKNAVFWDVTPRGSCKTLLFRGTYHVHHQGDKNRKVLRMLVTANIVHISPILVTLMMDDILSTEISVLTRITRHNIPEDCILLVPKILWIIFYVIMFLTPWKENKWYVGVCLCMCSFVYVFFIM
jgi:hypothetical protein